eukprot:3862471-Rhodomonas_salina.5
MLPRGSYSSTSISNSSKVVQLPLVLLWKTVRFADLVQQHTQVQHYRVRRGIRKVSTRPRPGTAACAGSVLHSHADSTYKTNTTNPSTVCAKNAEPIQLTPVQFAPRVWVFVLDFALSDYLPRHVGDPRAVGGGEQHQAPCCVPPYAVAQYQIGPQDHSRTIVGVSKCRSKPWYRGAFAGPYEQSLRSIGQQEWRFGTVISAKALAYDPSGPRRGAYLGAGARAR